MSTAIRVSDLLARGVRVEWHEGVAVVREVMERVLERGGATLPELSEIEISSEGRIAIGSGAGALEPVRRFGQLLQAIVGQADPPVQPRPLVAQPTAPNPAFGTIAKQDALGDFDSEGTIAAGPGAGTHEPVRRFGQLLQAILSQADPPVQLRLLIAQATAPNPAFGTIAEYEDALGYFERPDRAAVLRQLFERAAQMPVLGGSSDTPTLDAIAPLPVDKPVRTAESMARRHVVHRRALQLGAVAAVAVACAAGVVYAGRARVTQSTDRVSAMARKASDRMGTAVLNGVSKVSDTVGLGRIVPASQAAAPAPTVAPPPPPAPAARSNRRRAAAAPAARRVAPALASANILAFDLDPVAPLHGTGPDAVSARGPASTVPDPVGTDGTLAIYSSDSAGVSSPVGLRPQLPRELPPELGRDKLARIELLISPEGAVESVKLLGQWGVRDMMLLSAAKTWQFQPALRNGIPVRYRKTIWITFN